MNRKQRRSGCGTGFNASVWCNRDPCGIICAVISWFLVLYAETIVVGVIIYPWMGLSLYGLLNIGAFTTIAVMSLISHGKAMMSDPGAVPENALPVALANAPKQDLEKLEEQKYRSCRRCRQFKPARAHHCSICDRCVLKMDHHCPWVNNCVGLGNHKFFLLFIFYIFLLSSYAITLILMRFARCIHDTCPPNGAFLVVFLVLEAVLFGLFTLCMMCDQYSVISTGSTQIDRLKGETGDSIGVREVFGGSSNSMALHWFLPTNIWFPTSLKTKVLGYVLEEELQPSEDDATEADSFLTSDDEEKASVVSATETLEGGWSVQKRIPHEAADVV